MNSLRRSVCKSWFNARWRDLVAGFAQWVGGGEDTYLLPMGLGEGATIATRPFLFSAPMSLAPEIIAAVGGDSNTDEDDANLLAERLEDPAFRDFDDEEDERDQEPDGGAQE
jgi:hypothetical protein